MQLIMKAADRDIRYLTIKVLQQIIAFKWHTYTKRFFIYQLILLGIFVVSFLIDIILMGPPDGGLDSSGTQYLIGAIVTRSICFLLILWFSYYEVRQMRRLLKWKDYFTDILNICDLLFLASYIAYIPTSFILTPDRYGFKVLQSMIVFTTIIKINGYLRIFEDFGFLVQMITAAVRDSFDFIVYFLIILASFAIQISYLTTTLNF